MKHSDHPQNRNNTPCKCGGAGNAEDKPMKACSMPKKRTGKGGGKK